MAQVAKSHRWQQQKLRYRFLDTRNLGDGGTQSEIESVFAHACSKWAPHCGLTFAKSDADFDIGVKWAALGTKRSGEQIGGATTRSGAQAVITFNDDAHWVGTAYDPNFADLGMTALHEIGHALGMGHSHDPAAVMYFLEARNAVPRVFLDIDLDDVVGSNYLYQRPTFDPYPNLSANAKLVILANETDGPANYAFYVTHDGWMAVSLGKGSMPPGEITYWTENRDLFNLKRLYRVTVECAGTSLTLDDVSPKSQVIVYKKPDGTPALRTVFLTP